MADRVALPPKSPAAKVFADIAERSSGFRPARQTLVKVRAVPTIFPDLDRRSQVGGWPTDRAGIIHGPSGNGKTQLALGLGRSFLRRGHLFCLVDAEMTTPIQFAEKLMGEQASNPAFLAMRPKSYEQVVNDVRKTAEGVAEKRVKGQLPPDTTCLFVIDSIRKLVPEDIQERIRKMGAEGDKGSIDGYGGRAAQLRAALNAAWLDELTPLMYHTGCAIVFIGRESEDTNADARDRQFGNDWKLTGGRALFFDSSFVVRVSSAGFITTDPEKKNVVGERHLLTIRKTKVAANQDRVERAFFHTSNGKQQPVGFDRARDLIDLGLELGVLKRTGSWLTWERRRWQGDSKFVESAEPEVLDGIEAACRSQFGEDARAHAEMV